MILVVAIVLFILLLPCAPLIHLSGLAPTWWKDACASCLRGVRSKRRPPFTHHLISPGIVLGSVPCTLEHLDELVRVYACTSVMTLNMDWELQLSKKDIESKRLHHLHLPTPDFAPVSLSDLGRGVRHLVDELERGGCTYVHCNAGKGRSASVVICYLVEALDLDPIAAFRFVEAKRRIAKLTRLGGTLPQWRQIRLYCGACVRPTAPSGTRLAKGNQVLPLSP